MRHRDNRSFSLFFVASAFSLLLSISATAAEDTSGSVPDRSLPSLEPVGVDTTSDPMDPPEISSPSGEPRFPSISRSPTIGGGSYIHWLVMMITGGVRLEFEPLRDIFGIWASVGIAPYFLSSDGSYAPSMIELGVGIRLHPLPIGEVGRFYVDLERRSYWGLTPWSVGAGLRLGRDYRSSRVSVGLGLSYEWGEDTRPIENRKSQWRMVWVDLTGSFRLGFDEM